MHRFLTTALCAAMSVVPLMASAEGIYRVYGGQPFDVPGTGMRIELTGVTDQRCPSMAACVWEGTKRVELSVSQGAGAPQMIVLCNACDDGDGSVDIFGHKLDFQDILPPIEVIEGLGRPPLVTDYAVSLILDGQ